MTVCTTLLLMLTPLLSADADQLPEIPFRRGQPIRLEGRKIDVRYFDLDWSGFVQHGATEDEGLLLPGKNAVWLLQPKNHALRKVVEADWRALQIKPHDLLGVSRDFRLGVANLGSTTKRYPHRYQLGVADLSKSSLFSKIDVAWVYGDEGYKRLRRWKFDRKHKLALALSCSYADGFAWLDWGRGKSIRPDLSRDGVQPDSVSWTGSEIEPRVYCFVVECLRWKGLEVEDRETWYRRVTFESAKGGKVEVTDDPWKVVEVVDVDEGKMLCRLKDGRIAWIGARDWQLAAASTNGINAGDLITRTSNRIVVQDQDSLVSLAAGTLEKTAAAVLEKGSRPSWIGAFPRQRILAVIDAFQGLQMFDIETLKKIDRGPEKRTGRTANAGTLGMSLTQSGRFGIVATPYAKTVTIFGMENDFTSEIRTDRHPSGAFHIKTDDAEALLIITAPVPYE